MCTKKNRYQYFVSNEKVNKTRKGEIMKNLVVSIITVIIITVSLSITFANEMNVLPTFKEHRHMLNSDMDSVRTIIHQEIHPSGLIAELAIISLRDGDDYQDFVETSLYSPFTDSYTGLYLDQSYPDAPEYDYNALDIVHYNNCEEADIYWWGDNIYHSSGSQIDADYPLVSAWREGVVEGVTYYLKTEINLDFDFQDEFEVQWRFTQTYDGDVVYIIPDSSNNHDYDQQGWPIWVETWDLRPNIYPHNVVIETNGDPISGDNPAYVGQNLRINVEITENEGFWAGNDIEIRYYVDGNYDNNDDETEEIDAWETDDERSDNFTVSTEGTHCISITIDYYDDVNETNENDSETEHCFQVNEAPIPPTVTIDDPEYYGYNDLVFGWTVYDENGGTPQSRDRLDSDSWSNWGYHTSRNLMNISSTSHTFYVEVKDQTNLTGSDNYSFTIDASVDIQSIPNQSVIYGETLELDISASGGSGSYVYGAGPGVINSNGHYSWTPEIYNPNPTPVSVSATCTDHDDNSDIETCNVTMILSPVEISGLETSYTIEEGSQFSDSEIIASGGDLVNYSWNNVPTLNNGFWVTLGSLDGSSTSLQGQAPYVNEDTDFGYDLACNSQSELETQSYIITVTNIEILVEPEIETLWSIMNQEIDEFTVTATGLEDGQCVWSLQYQPSSNNGNPYAYGLSINAEDNNCTATISGAPTALVDLPIYVGKYDAWQIQGVTNVMINAFPPVIYYPQPPYTFFQYQDAQIQLNASGGDNIEYTWIVEDDCLMNLESAEGHEAIFSVNTETVGSFTCNVTCQQANFLDNDHSEQININIEGSFWSVDTLELIFPPIQDTQTVTLTNTTINGSPFNYTLSLSSPAYYEILSLLSGSLSSGEQAVIEIMSYDNNNPYELSAQLLININGGAFTSIVELTTLQECNLALGDVNGDETLDVLDIVAIVAYVLGTAETEFDECQIEAGDYNNDGDIDVLDIIALLVPIIGETARSGTATEAKIVKYNDGIILEANGYVNGIQMVLSHSDGFNIQLSNAFIADYVTEGTLTKVIIINPEGTRLFSTSEKFEVVSILAATTSGYIDAEVVGPTEFILNAAYPNPFNPTTTVSYNLPEMSQVKLTVYTLNGKKVMTMVNGIENAGYHEVTLNFNEFSTASGVYFMKLEIPSNHLVQKLLYIK
ncbi:T9SS type A sorting domain-containing protein [bacterium]|nr:T9SS type A sorting domain-containing protein [bacterium]